MPWIETRSPSFSARHAKGEDAGPVLELLESTRQHLLGLFPQVPDDVAVVLHASRAALVLAQPVLPAVWALTDGAGRRYVAGWFSGREVHVLAPRLLALRSSALAESRAMMMLCPAALYAQLVVGANNPALPPPFRPQRSARYARWAWLAAGAGQYFSGQTRYCRAAIARRLREGRPPTFPPRVRDAGLLGGSIFDLMAGEHGEHRAVTLACASFAGGARATLGQAFPGRSLAETEALWREHLGDLAGR